MSKAPLSRAGAAPGSLGLTGTAGLQFKPKKFGLQKPKPLAAAGFGAAAGSASIFGEVADDDPVSVREELRRLAESKQKKAAAHAAQAAVLAQDPSIYDYDGAYDSITNERESAREAKKGKAAAMAIGLAKIRKRGGLDAVAARARCRAGPDSSASVERRPI